MTTSTMASDTAAAPLSPIAELAGASGHWRRPHLLQRDYELREGDRRFGRLTWSRGIHPLARLETSDGVWEIVRKGFWNPRVLVRRPGEDAPLAEFERGFTGNGTLQFENGPRYLWKFTGFWRGRYSILTADEAVVLTVRPVLLGGLRGLLMEFASGAKPCPELPILAGLAAYFRIVAAAHAHGAH